MNFDPYGNRRQPESVDVINEGKRVFSRVGIAIATFVCVYYALQIFLMFALVSIYPPSRNAWWFNWVLSLVPLYLFALPAMYLVLKGIEKAPHNDTYEKNPTAICEPPSVLQKPRLTVKMWLVMLVVSFGFTYIGSFISNFIMAIMTLVTGHDYQNALVGLTENTPAIVTFIFACVLAPIGEEFIFRKLLIDRTRRYGDTVAILVSAISFALFHGNLFQLFYAFFLGMAFAYMYTLSGKLYWSILAHISVNTIGGLLVPMLADYINLDALTTGDINALVESIIASPIPYILYVLFSVAVYVLMPAAIVILVLFRKKLAFSKGEIRIPPSQMAETVLLNGGMFLSFILLLGIILMSLLP